MVRVRTAVSSRRRKKRVIKRAKGQFGHRSKRYAQARRSLLKGMAYSYRDRKVKKRLFRSLWIVRIKAACQDAGIAYSRFMQGLRRAHIEIDRKLLAELAIQSPGCFKKLVRLAQEVVPAAPSAHKGA